MTLDIITADSLHPFRHGFFTRRGGASSGVFAGLNCGHGSSDQTEIVAINRDRVAKAMGMTAADMRAVHQIHSADVSAADDIAPAETPKADALVTNTPGILLTILTADCQPVLFADPKAGVVGAAHAGWKGALSGILETTIASMEKLGAKPENIVAVIGPTISQKAYEVGQEFLETFLDEDDHYARFFANGAAGKYHFDLPAFGLHRLRQAGVTKSEWTRHCTYSDDKRFFSYRRSVHRKEADYGRLISVISI